MSDRFQQFIAAVTSAVSASAEEPIVLPQVRAFPQEAPDLAIGKG